MHSTLNDIQAYITQRLIHAENNHVRHKYTEVGWLVFVYSCISQFFLYAYLFRVLGASISRFVLQSLTKCLVPWYKIVSYGSRLSDENAYCNRGFLKTAGPKIDKVSKTLKISHEKNLHVLHMIHNIVRTLKMSLHFHDFLQLFHTNSMTVNGTSFHFPSANMVWGGRGQNSTASAPNTMMACSEHWDKF
jgi:hypothetical protein